MRLLLLMIRLAILPDWMHYQYPDQHHFYRRKFTTQHHAKRKVVKKIWLFAGAIMICFPALPFVIITSLLTLLLSLAVLDETS